MVEIKELKNLIKYYENQRDEQLRFIQTDKFKGSISEPIDNNVNFVYEHTNSIYNGYISELHLAIAKLEVMNSVEQAKKQSLYRSSRRKLRTTSHHRKVSSRSKERTRGRRNIKKPSRKAY
jgi:hypothetical protein